MGSDANVYVFDYDRYKSEVVPALRALLLSGELAPWLASIIDTRLHPAFDVTLLRNTDLLRYCTYLTPELAPVEVKEDCPPMKDWSRRTCRSEQCLARSWCPFHKQVSQKVIEELHFTIRSAIANRCLIESASLFVGRTMNATDYTKLLDHLKLPSDHSLRILLQALATRGFIVGYGWTLSGDGIHGWLDPSETTQLLENLRQLPLPQYEPTEEAIHALLHASQAKGRSFFEDAERRLIFTTRPGSSVPIGRLAPEDQERDAVLEIEWLALSLSFVRTVAATASKQGKGLLWANDLSVH